MNKGLQALKRLQGENRVGVYDETDICQDLETAEYYLQALDIVKEKKVNVFIFLHSGDLETYNDMVEDNRKLSKEEFGHLIEVFGND